MRTKDHRLLAKWLLAREGDGLSGRFAVGLYLGSVLPDYNPFTYLRGVSGSQGCHGHNAEINERRICRLLSDLKRSDGSDFLAGLRLGTALHYLADAFTYPHHAYYPGSLADHVAYEASLHRELTKYLSQGCRLTWKKTEDFPTYLADMLRLYRQCRKNERTDCCFITQLCGLALAQVLHSRKNEEVSDENSDYDRSIPAAR